jgi:hypothetical protein
MAADQAGQDNEKLREEKRKYYKSLGLELPEGEGQPDDAVALPRKEPAKAIAPDMGQQGGVPALLEYLKGRIERVVADDVNETADGIVAAVVSTLADKKVAEAVRQEVEGLLRGWLENLQKEITKDLLRFFPE